MRYRQVTGGTRRGRPSPEADGAVKEFCISSIISLLRITCYLYIMGLFLRLQQESTPFQSLEARVVAPGGPRLLGRMAPSCPSPPTSPRGSSPVFVCMGTGLYKDTSCWVSAQPSDLILT